MLSSNPRSKLYKKLFNESLDLIILASLDKKSMCGSELADYITKKLVSINSSILYKRLKIMRKEGLITYSRAKSALNRRKTDHRKSFYKITEVGRGKFREEKEEFDSFAEDLDQLLRYV